MKILMLGSALGARSCGVSHYTETLAGHLISHGMTVSQIAGPWRAAHLPRLVSKIEDAGYDVIHIQYPTVAYGRSLAPQIVSLLKSPVVVTLHETQHVHWLRRAAMLPFTLSAKTLIFTNENDRRYATGVIRWINARSIVIPIGSAIPPGVWSGRRDAEVVYFGLIRRNKGLEHFLTLANLASKARLPFTFRIVGTPDTGSTGYLDDLRLQSRSLPIHWTIGQDDTAVAGYLSKACLAYLPFPDGASERRSSLLALMANGVVVMSPIGPATPPEMAESIVDVATPQAGFEFLRQVRGHAERLAGIAQKAERYVRSTFSWDSIAEAHIKIYRRVATPLRGARNTQ